MKPILLILIYFALTIGHAAWHWYLIENKNRLITSCQKIKEWTIISILAAVLLIHSNELLPLIIFPIVNRLAFFDPFLNLMRGNDWLYEGVASKKKSWWDYVEYKIGLPIWMYRISYFAMYLIYIITFTDNAK